MKFVDKKKFRVSHILYTDPNYFTSKIRNNAFQLSQDYSRERVEDSGCYVLVRAVLSLIYAICNTLQPSGV